MGFSALPVPHPSGGPLYVKLRDNPAAIHGAMLTIQQLPVPADDAGRSEARQSAEGTAPAAQAALPADP